MDRRPAPPSAPRASAPPQEPSPEPSRAAGVPEAAASRLMRSAWWWVRAAAIAVTLLAGYQLLVVVGGFLSALLTVFLYLVFGAVVSFVAAPLVNALHRHARIPRTAAILLVLGGGVLVVALAVYAIAGPTADEARTLAGRVPGYLDRLNSQLVQLRNQLHTRGVDIGTIDVGQYAGTISSRLTQYLVSGIATTVLTLFDAIVALVVAFWLLKDGAMLRVQLLTLLPGRLRVNAEFALDAFEVVIGGYVRAQLVLAVIIGALAGVGCAVLGVPFPIVIALAAFVFELVPIVGPFLGGAVAVLLAFTVSGTLALLTVGLFVLIHILESYVLGPRIQARFVRLHPVISLLALFAGIEVGGFLGALFAIPLTSLVAVFIRATVGDLRASRPELFATRSVDLYTESRRQRILGEFRLFKTSPWVIARSWLRREAGAPAGGAPPLEPPSDPGTAEE